MKGQGRDGFCPFFEDFCFILIDFFLGNGLRKKADLSVSFFYWLEACLLKRVRF